MEHLQAGHHVESITRAGSPQVQAFTLLDYNAGQQRLSMAIYKACLPTVYNSEHLYSHPSVSVHRCPGQELKQARCSVLLSAVSSNL